MAQPSRLNRNMRILFFGSILLMVVVIFWRNLANKKMGKGPKYFNEYQAQNNKIEYHENGYVKYLGKVEEGTRVGEWVLFDSTGKAIRKDVFENGQVVRSDSIIEEE